MDPERPLHWLVLLRAAVVSGLAVALGTAAHVSSDGLMPSDPTVLVLFVLCVGGSVPALAWPASRARVLTLLAAGQLFIHLGLTVTAGHRGSPGVTAADRGFASSPSTRRTGSLFDQYQAYHPQLVQTGQTEETSAAGGPAAVAHLWQHLTEQSPWMLLTHSLAVVVVGLWLAAGESALWALLALTAPGVSRCLRRLLTAVTAPAVVQPRVEQTTVALRARERRRHAVPTPCLLRQVLARRGPPLLLAS